MRKYAIPASVVILLVAVVVYFVWQDNKTDSNSQVPPTPNPSQMPAPAPVPTPNPNPAPTFQDYKAPFKTFNARGVTVEYPESWTLSMPLPDDKWGILSVLSPSTKSSLDAGQLNGYPYDLRVGQSSDLFNLLGNSYTKQEDITVGGKKGYRVAIAGNGYNEGVVIEHNGFYLLDFQPGMDRKLQDEILKHVKFTN